MFQTQLLEKLIFLPKVLSETEIYQEKKNLREIYTLLISM